MFNSNTCENVVTVYRYEKTSNEDLQFEKGERLTILQRLTHYKVADRGLVHALTAPFVDMERVYMQRLRDHHWIPREHITLGQKLGHGEFGEVIKAKIGDREVAVKRYKASAKRQLIYEACIMSELRHDNLLELLGVTEEPDEDDAAVTDGELCMTFCLVTEFSPLGSLLSYLRSRGRALLGPATLLSFATDVARGLAYMEAHSYLHCDVAARNVLLFSPANHSFYPVAKLGDFGLAFRLQPSPPSSAASPTSAYRVTGVVDLDNGKRSTTPPLTGTQRMANITRIPIKWTAPESIRTRIFTHKSDVWSFGVMLWELYSYGRLPYPRLMTSQVLAHLEAGERMEAPQDCPKEIYSLMLETWASEPRDRPSFVQILQRLQREFL
ncbi:unnamed protein product [Taenia asiatica]|uniref:Non-specific protein-tyrosine kinase n=1 Tax=Taenia asiatica TaxID=60517 RepID=A0A0R3VW40_TAEAS|nr:unnamed protein product [Taenia asiatica]